MLWPAKPALSMEILPRDWRLVEIWTTNAALARLEREFASLYARIGRPSIAPDVGLPEFGDTVDFRVVP